MKCSINKTSFLSALAAAGALSGLIFGQPARATDCFGCYDDANGKEQCTTVQVGGACTVGSFCAAVPGGCNGVNTKIRPVGNLVVPSAAPRPTTLPKLRMTN